MSHKSLTTNDGKSRLSLPKHVYAFRFSFRKRAILRRFLGGIRVTFVQDSHKIPTDSTVLVWGSKSIPNLPDNTKLVRVEDGFLRSVGLGVDLIQPLSWVIDQTGIYYDATQASDLEQLLIETNFDESLLNRANLLHERIVAHGLTKYNIGTQIWNKPIARHIILVVGQVESDASIRLGSPEIFTNLALLREVRKHNLEAYIVYKPHPDVLAGLRAQGSGEAQAHEWCNEIVTDISMAAMLPNVDEVHVMTSLAGFEALLRGKSVTCYGLPFYAGWGLTSDKLQTPRRNRTLSLTELIAGALILYPTYVSQKTLMITTPEVAIDELLWQKNLIRNELPWWRKVFRVILRTVDGVK